MTPFENSQPRDFIEIDSAIKERYGQILAERYPGNKEITWDIIEIWEDMERLHPILAGIVNQSLSSEEFRESLLELEVRVWHISDHLSNLSDVFDKSD